MLLTRYTTITLAIVLLIFPLTVPVFGQLGFKPTIKKPKEFENRVLRSEKSDQKKFTLPKRFIQNTVTHYNFYFNANTKLNEVLDRAKSSYTDDFSQLIPFYNYTLEATAADSIQLDSIAFKAQTGIVLHDLRNDWVDNLYILWGASYYFRQQFDSAYLMFQFINYAFAQKESDGYYKVIGSARDGNNAMNISTREKSNLAKKIFSEPPSRNDAFIWQIRNYLAQDRFADAGSLISTLKNDPDFPSRLNDDLNEVQAYSFYKQQMWDSAAAYLEQALNMAEKPNEKARWEYLLGQLYEKTGKYKEAENFYSKSISLTTDPIMDVYARLALVRVNKDDEENYINENIASLLKMAKRDKYVDYRDIIYYMAAQMELERKNSDAAYELLLKSTKYITTNNPAQRNKAFLQLAELDFEKKKYRQSYNFYDSLQISDPALKDPETIVVRKAILGKLAGNLEITERQDSLQRLASLPEDERKSLIKKLVRQLRKARGLKDEDIIASPKSQFNQEAPPSLFAGTNKKGEWYFYNKTSKERGSAEFEAKWGKRANEDNWRRSAALSAGYGNNNSTESVTIRNANNADTPETEEITFESLSDKLPLTPEKLKVSNDSLQIVLFETAIIYIQDLEDCSSGTQALEELRSRFPQHPKLADILFNLYYCYNKQGENSKAANIKKLMEEQFAGHNLTNIMTTANKPGTKVQEQPATAAYEKIYDLFIEGNFTEAIIQKRIADSLFGTNHWTPQLLYIEAVYYIKERKDSLASIALNSIITNFEGSPLLEKATNLFNVLRRREEIEEELKNLVINMPDTTSRQVTQVVSPITVPVIKQQEIKKDSVVSKPKQPPTVTVYKPKSDTLTKQPVNTGPIATTYSFDAEKPHYVLIILNKVDPVFVTEAKNAFIRYNTDTYFNKQMQAELIDLDSENKLLLVSPFKNSAEAIAYIDQTKPRTSTEIVPWLKGGKYTYSIITERNLEVLKNSKAIDKYKQFLEKNIPGKF